MNKKQLRRKASIDSSKVKRESYTECMKAAYRLLKYRQRSETEIREKLRVKYPKTSIDMVIKSLREKHMVDDVVFARYWRERREALNPRSKRLVAVELKKKGIDKEVINTALDGYNDIENAYRASRKIAGSRSVNSRSEFIRKTGSFLMRRGFNYEVAKQTADRLWSERV
jgi:regulatory protein